MSRSCAARRYGKLVRFRLTPSAGLWDTILNESRCILSNHECIEGVNVRQDSLCGEAGLGLVSPFLVVLPQVLPGAQGHQSKIVHVLELSHMDKSLEEFKQLQVKFVEGDSQSSSFKSVRPEILPTVTTPISHWHCDSPHHRGFVMHYTSTFAARRWHRYSPGELLVHCCEQI